MKKILSLLLLVSLSAKGQNYFSDKIALSNAVYGVAATVVKERGASGSTAAALAMLSNEATSGYKTSRLIEELKREQLWDDCVFLQVFGRGHQNASNNITLRGPRTDVAGESWRHGLTRRSGVDHSVILPNAVSNFTAFVAMAGSAEADSGNERNIFVVSSPGVAPWTMFARVYKTGGNFLFAQTAFGSQQFVSLGSTVSYNSLAPVSYGFSRFYTNYVVFTNGVQAANTNYAHWNLEGMPQFNFGGLKGTYSVVGVWRRNMTTNELATLHTVVKRTVFTANVRIILEGDSIINFMSAATGHQSAWNKDIFGWGSDWSASGSVYDISTGGHSTTHILAEWPGQLRTYITNTLSDERNIVLVWAGSNDLGNYSSASRSVATIHDNLRAIWNSARTNGCYVVAAPVLRRAIFPGRPIADLDELNRLIRGDEGVYYDALIDHDAAFVEAYGPNYFENTVLFPDGLHPGSYAAQEIIGRAARKASAKIFGP